MHSHLLFGVVYRAIALLVFTVISMPHSAQGAPLHQTPPFSGVWSNTQCEPYPGGPFAQRQLTISGGNFQHDVTSFADAKCTIPTLRTRYEGAFIVRGPSPTIPETWDVEFVVRQVRLTPYVLNTADFLNTAPRGTCGREAWFVGVEQELAATQGCPLLGINLRRPLVEYDIATVQGNLLFLGQRPPSGGFLTSPALRPTAFGPPLTRTGDVAILLPSVGDNYDAPLRMIGIGAAFMLAGAALVARVALGRRGLRFVAVPQATGSKDGRKAEELREARSTDARQRIADQHVQHARAADFGA